MYKILRDIVKTEIGDILTVENAEVVGKKCIKCNTIRHNNSIF